MASSATQEEKTRAEIEKLEAETALLRDEFSSKKKWKWLGKLTGIGGVLSVLIAAGTVTVTSMQWRAEFARERSVRIETTFDSALARLSLPEPRGRTIGVITLQSFLTKQHPSRHRQVVLALGNTLATEPNGMVRRAILSAFSKLTPEAVSTEALNELVNTLTEISRSAEEAAMPYQTEGVGIAIASLLRAGSTVRDLNGISCLGCDFTDLDLSGAVFDNADLTNARFCRADLTEASFDRTDLHRADFFGATLRNSSFSHTPRGSVVDVPAEHFVERRFKRMSKGEDLVIYGPNFDCADLSGAVFSGFPAIVLVPEGVSGFVQSTFKGAELRDARLEHVHYYGINRLDDPRPSSFTGTWALIGETSQENVAEARTWYFDDAGSLSRSELEIFDLSRLEVAFSGSNWADAHLPPALEQLFKISPPSEEPVLGAHERTCLD